MKLSEEISKITLPGPKSVVRILDGQGKPLFDLLCTPQENDQIQAGVEFKYYLKKDLNSDS